nr:MAG TPA: hypothetical protein [Caudoviricetes sp.]
MHLFRYFYSNPFSHFLHLLVYYYTFAIVTCQRFYQIICKYFLISLYYSTI